MNTRKISYRIKGLWNEKIDVLKDVMSSIGIVVTLNKFVECVNVEILKNICNNLNSVLIYLILPFLIFVCYKHCPKNEYRYKVKGVKGDAFVSIYLGDVLIDKGSIVVPVNSCFDTAMDSNMISDECIQGQFQNKYFRGNLSSLDTLIDNDLNKYDNFEIIERSAPMKNKRYPLGSIAMINVPEAESKKRVYLLSVANMNQSFNPENPTLDAYRGMISNFWNEIGEYGHNEKRLVVSVIGVGRAGYTVDIEMALACMVSAYIEAVREKNIVENLAIYINWESIGKRGIKMDKIKKHVKAICKYKKWSF